MSVPMSPMRNEGRERIDEKRMFDNYAKDWQATQSAIVATNKKLDDQLRVSETNLTELIQLMQAKNAQKAERQLQQSQAKNEVERLKKLESHLSSRVNNSSQEEHALQASCAALNKKVQEMMIIPGKEVEAGFTGSLDEVIRLFDLQTIDRSEEDQQMAFNCVEIDRKIAQARERVNSLRRAAQQKQRAVEMVDPFNVSTETRENVMKTTMEEKNARSKTLVEMRLSIRSINAKS